MKITQEQPPKQFVPVIITLETQEEVDQVYSALQFSNAQRNHSYNLWSFLDEIKSSNGRELAIEDKPIVHKNSI